MLSDSCLLLEQSSVNVPASVGIQKSKYILIFNEASIFYRESYHFNGRSFVTLQYNTDLQALLWF